MLLSLMSRPFSFATLFLSAVMICGPGHARSKPVPGKPLPTTVIAFSGYIAGNDTYQGSGTAKIVDDLQALGMAAEVHGPGEWRAVADELVKSRRPEGPVVIFGYSMGAGAATSLADRLAQAGIRVRALVLIEAWNPDPVPANVDRAVHYYVSFWAKNVVPGPQFAGSLDNVDLRTVMPDIAKEGHLSMSHMKSVQQLVIDEVVKSVPVSRPAAGPKRR